MNTLVNSNDLKINILQEQINSLHIEIQRKVWEIIFLQNFTLETPTLEDISEMSLFFRENIKKYAEKFNDSKYLAYYLSSHARQELAQRIHDPKFFFSIIRNKNRKIVWIFEARESPLYPESHEIWWILVDEKHQWMQLGSLMDYDFIMYCKERNIQSILVRIAMNNPSSCAIKEKFGFKTIDDCYLQGFEKIL